MRSEPPLRPWRIAVLTALPLLFALALLLALYGLQIVNADSYEEESRSTHYSTELVPAARGRLLDRNGRELVTNRVSYTLLLEREALVTHKDPNGILLTLIGLTRAEGLSHTDTLPISAGAPFAYTPMTETQAGWLSEYLAHFALEDLTASALMDWLREHYAIPASYDDEEARLAAGVRWELELRTLFGLSDYVFAADLSTGLIAAVTERGYPGVRIGTQARRAYATRCAPHVLGRIGPMDQAQLDTYLPLGYPMNALVGQDGAEALFEAYLHGRDGERVTVRNDAGEILESYYTTQPQAGSDVYLTLDLTLQQAAEEALAAEIRRINEERQAAAAPDEAVQLASAGAVVVLQVGTGDVLASVSYPGYALDSFYEDYARLLADPTSPMVNRATMGTYAPGSTFKPVAATAALSEGIITPDSTIYDRAIIDEYAGYSYKCWIYPGSHGSINVKQALQMSCNYFFYTVGRELGIDTLDRFAQAYGLGEATGIELPERTGVLASRSYKEEAVGESWYTGDTLQASIGQSYHLFTPMQLASYAAAIAADGTRYAAHILSQVDGPERFRYRPTVLSQVEADGECFQTLREGMRLASRYGSASYELGDYPISVCSKTGTAQLGENAVNNAVFIAFAPMEAPEIAISVVVENGGAGSYLARVARQILDRYFAREDGAAPVPEDTLLP